MVVWEGEAQKGGFGGGTLVTRGRPCPLAPRYRQPSARTTTQGRLGGVAGVGDRQNGAGLGFPGPLSTLEDCFSAGRKRQARFELVISVFKSLSCEPAVFMVTYVLIRR